MAYKNYIVPDFVDFAAKYHKYIYKCCKSLSRARYWLFRSPEGSRIILVNGYYLVVKDIDYIKVVLDLSN